MFGDEDTILMDQTIAGLRVCVYAAKFDGATHLQSIIMWVDAPQDEFNTRGRRAVADARAEYVAGLPMPPGDVKDKARFWLDVSNVRRKLAAFTQEQQDAVNAIIVMMRVEYLWIGRLS